MTTIRVLVVDDHTLFRGGIKLLLQRQTGFEVIGEAGGGLEGIKAARRLNPDVILLDLHMPEMSGLETIPLLREEVPQARIIMLTVSEDAEDLLQALQAGACGYLLKNIDTDFLLQSIARAAAGESVMSPQMASKLARVVRAPVRSASAAASQLSPREREIIGKLVHGSSNKEIARQLGLAESTVKIHVQGILRKLQLSSRVQAAVYAVEHGLVDES